MAALEQARDDVTSAQLVDGLAEGIEPRQYALARYNTELHRHEAAGRVEQAGMTRGGWQRPPAILWRITDAGREWLRDVGSEAARAPLAGAGEDAEDRRLAQGREQLAAASARGYGRDTPPAIRRQVARELRYAGCTLDEIGQVFSVSREAIRLDLLPGSTR